MSYNNEDLLKLIELHKQYIYNDKRRLGCLQDTGVQHSEFGNENLCETKSEVQNFVSKSEETKQYPDNSINKDNEVGQNFPLVEQLDLSSCNGSLAKDKQAFIDKIANSENPLSFRSDAGSGNAMLRYGEFSPNNPQLRVAAAPYLGLGEYEQRRALISKQRQADYNAHISQKNDLIKSKVDNFFVETLPSKHKSYNKAVQTDIQNIHHKLVQYELRSHNPPEKELSPQPVFTANNTMHSNRSPILSRSEHRFSSSQNVRPETSKPKSILSSRRTESVRDYHYSYVPSILDGFSYEDRADLLEKERLKREAYQLELRQQIEEKRRLAALRDEQDRREQELENRRFEQQLLKMQEEQYREDQYRTQKNQMFRRTSEDLKMYRDDQLDRSFRKHADSESSVTSLRNTKVASRQLSHYSPPVSRRVPYSFNVPSTSTFANHPNRSESVNRDEPRSRSNSFNRYESALNRHESLSRIDSLQRQESLNRLDSLSIKDSICRVPRRHSATQQDFSLMRRSPKSQRSDRSSCSRLDDPLPIPILKAHSPVAKDLKNSIAIDSSKRSTDTVRKLEDRWQVPVVQRNIITHSDPRDGQGRSILTQLGAIRLQLQKEQLRMDETLRKRGISQPKAV
ncbi:hypothetical protein PPYR_01693 [Photinus pyralis]|uniref:CCDC66 domain-containing protein n=1 Tax=Photinus pyralis TaxID=7054 RepID=A0A5N4B5A3_PHOPY|nr:uncharacterized protein LOC116160408 isoform X3 [Photinus pyralis]KAB0804723.1 hypothetical protein PPYR_01693 [Photinus pyralis]